MRYKITVSGIGTVRTTNNYDTAQESFQRSVEASKKEGLPASGQDVVLWDFRNPTIYRAPKPLASITDEELIDKFLKVSDALLKPITDEMQRRGIAVEYDA